MPTVPPKLRPGSGWWVLQEGEAAGTIVGGNLCTLNLLQGAPFMPPLDGSVVFVEDDDQVKPWDFDRDLVSLLQQPTFAGVAGVVIGRFQKATRAGLPRRATRAPRPTPKMS
jgi:muramoyltetrapeptide carboxypeptidase